MGWEPGFFDAKRGQGTDKEREGKKKETFRPGPNLMA